MGVRLRSIAKCYEFLRDLYVLHITYIYRMYVTEVGIQEHK